MDIVDVEEEFPFFCNLFTIKSNFGSNDVIAEIRASLRLTLVTHKHDKQL